MDTTMKKTVMKTSCMEDTAKSAYEMAQSAEPGQVYALIGDLGVGKTVFTKGFARGLGIEEPVSSPTFTILQIYEEGRLPLYHFDVYRIEEPEETIYVVIEKDLEKGVDYRKITVVRPE